MRHAVLHIGTHKTGSTYLQSWLVRNRNRLLAFGIRTATDLMHFHRVAAESVVELDRRATGAMKSVLEVQLDKAINEIRAAPADDSDEISVISSEFYWDMPPDNVRRALEGLGVSVKKIICFVRRQDRLEASSYNQAVKATGLISRYRTTPYWEGLDWNALYGRWREAFPEAELCFHGYDYLRRRDMILAVFKREIGCPDTFPGEYLPDRARSNISYDAEILEIARMANQRKLFTLTRQLRRMSGDLFQGPAFGFSQEVVSEIERTYRPGNVLLANRLRSHDIIEIALPGWQSDGSDLYGTVPIDRLLDRLLDLLGRFERRLINVGALPKQALEPRTEPFIQLHRLAKKNAVAAGTLLATAEGVSDSNETRMPLISAESGGGELPVDSLLKILEFAATLLNSASPKRITVHTVGTFESAIERRQVFKRTRQPDTEDVISKRDLKSLSHIAKQTYKRVLFRLRHPHFDAGQYLASRPDLLIAEVDPFVHYSEFGWKEGGSASFLGDLRHPRPPFRATNKLKFLGSPSQADRERPAVLVVLHEGTLTGAPIIGYNLILGLLKTYNVFALFLHGGAVAQACRDAGAMVAIAHKRCRSWSEGGHFIRQICRLHGFKFAIVNSVEARFVLGGLKVCGIPTVSLIHEFASYIVPTNQFRFAIELSSEAVFPAQMVRRNAIDVVPELAGRSFHVIPQGLCELPSKDKEQVLEPVEEIRRRMGVAQRSAESVVIVGIAYVSFRKGVDLFIQCASRILRSNPDKECHFVWVGDAYNPDKDGNYSVFLADQIKREGLAGRLHFSGGMHNMPAVYAEADMMLLTSRLDPLPNVALEALCHGLPLVCFDNTTGITEFLSEAGLSDECVARFLDVDDMARKASKLIQSTELRRRVVEESKTAALSTFNSDRYCVQIEGLALELVARQEAPMSGC